MHLLEVLLRRIADKLRMFENRWCGEEAELRGHGFPNREPGPAARMSFVGKGNDTDISRAADLVYPQIEGDASA
jgi:hypothetical protein